VNIKCEIDYVTLTNTKGYAVSSVCSTCTRCGHQEESFGDSDASVLRCLMLTRQNCSAGTLHYYVEDDGIPDDRERYEPRYQGDPTCNLFAEGLALHLRIKAAYEQLIADRCVP
jgi:hypothetical protein